MLKWAIEVNMHVKIDDEMILDVDVWLSMWPINPSIPNIIRAENTKPHVIFSSVYWMCQWKSDRFTKCHLSLELKWIDLISLLRKRQREREYNLSLFWIIQKMFFSFWSFSIRQRVRLTIFMCADLIWASF